MKELRIHVETFFDIQKTRIAVTNRIKAYQRLGVEVPGELNWFLEDTRLLEDKIKFRIMNVMKHMPLYTEWASKVKGIGPLLLAQAVALIGDISRFPNVSKLWKYSGYHVEEGKAPRKRRGAKASWNHKLKTVFWKIGRQLIMAKGSYYRYYLKFRKYYDEREDLKDESDLHKHMMAMRRMIKLFISHLWAVWRELEGLPVTEPYPIAILGHKTYISPWDMTE